MNITEFVAGRELGRVAFAFVLVASTRSRPLDHVARLIATRSGAAGAPGLIVSDVVRVTPNHDAVMVATCVLVTAVVATAKAALAAPPLTTTSGGTTTAALLL